jgi:hypothetical protein
MPELLQTFSAMQKTEEEKRIFLASLQDKTLEKSQDHEGPTFEDIRRRAMGINARGDDVVSLQGTFAQEAGFGVGMGLGYSKE